ncbi:arabinofuranosidase catalytic domain-containing protein [Rhodococcus ruber]
MATAHWFTYGGEFTGAGATLPLDELAEPDPLLLDLIPVASYQAYAMRRLSLDYTGPALTVRRSSDNTTQDIGFGSDGSLDTTALLAFAGSGDAFVSAWFDQSGNGRNMLQATATLQPQLVSAGALITIGTAPAMTFGTDRHLRHTQPGFVSRVAAGGVSLCEVHTDQNNTASYGESDQTSNGGRIVPFFWSSATPPLLNLVATENTGTNISAAGSHAGGTVGQAHADILIKPQAAGISRYRDGENRSFNSTWNPALATNTTAASIGGWPTGAATVSTDYTGKTGEHIMFSGVLDATAIATLHASQSAYFGTP